MSRGGGGQNLHVAKGKHKGRPYVPPKGLTEHITRLLTVITIGLIVGGSCLVIDLTIRGLTGVH